MSRLALLVVLAAVIGAATLSEFSGAVFTDRKTNPQTLTAASTWPTPTPTATPTPTPTPTPPPGTGLKARYRNNNPTVVSDNAITPWLQLVNGTTAPINIASAKLRYWFTKDTAGATVNTYCDYALLDCSKIAHVALPFSPVKPLADSYLEVGFAAGTTLAAGGTTGDIQLRVHKADWSNFNETNDYSWGSDPNFLDWPKVGVYYNGVLVWGTPP